MKVLNCPWELDNLDRKVVEVSISASDSDISYLSNLEKDNDYIVVKTHTSDCKLYKSLSQQGYFFIEAQISIRKNINSINVSDKLVSRYLNSSDTKKITSEDELKELLQNMTEGMFSTDRIYLDPEFGPNYSLRRYRNWIFTEFHRGATLLKHYYRNCYIGFSMCKIKDNVVDGLLSGTFEKYQNAGLGMFLPLIPLAYQDENVNIFEGKISSNNYPVIRMYQLFNYDFYNFEYVFVKHIKH